MPFYETVYETGRMSVACYEDDDEAKAAIAAHHERAVTGQPGGPLGAPAERIAAVYVYDKHPNEYNADQTLSADVAEKEVKELIAAAKDENGVITTDQLAIAVRGLSHPMGAVDGFNSRFRMKETKKLNMNFLDGGAS